MFVIRGQCILNNVTKDTSCSLFKQRNKCLWKEELFVLWGGDLYCFLLHFIYWKEKINTTKFMLSAGARSKCSHYYNLGEREANP